MSAESPIVEQPSARSEFAARMQKLEVEIACLVEELYSPRIHAARLEVAKVHFAMQKKREADRDGSAAVELAA